MKRLIPRPVHRPWGGERLRPLCDPNVPCEKIGEAYIHEGAVAPRLLFKWIDAQETLSVQNHPTQPGYSKNEIWYFIEPPASGKVVTGYDGELLPPIREERLLYTEVKAGEALDIPAGVLHAIGAGSFVFEVSETTDVTYRVYDWHRQGRELHLEQARAAWNRAAPVRIKPPSGPGVHEVIRKPEYTLVRLVGPVHHPAPAAAVLAYVAGPRFGETWLMDAGESAEISAGEVAILTTR